MKTFKLIKEYPSSPPLGTIIQTSYNLEHYKKYSEFWKEIKELDYEILSFINPTTKEIYYKRIYSRSNTIVFCTKDQFNNYSTIGERDEKYCLKHYQIHSIKRFFDNETFTINDRYQVIDPIKEIRTISSINISNDKIMIKPKEFGFSELNDIQKIKQPLFKTEDGVEIFENDRYWSVKTNWVICEYVASIHYTFPTIRFSTKEAAEEYILMNKPCLSINDIISEYGVTISKLIKMKELVKSRL